MFNLLLSLIIGLFIGWNFHAFFLQLNPPNIFKNNIDIMQFGKKEIPPSIDSSEISIEEIKQNIQILKNNIPKKVNKEKNISIPKIQNIKKAETFYDFLHNDLFSDAMSLYIDASEKKLLFYQSTLLQYFEIKILENPQKVVEEMLEFQELEAPKRKINLEILDEIEDNNYKEKAKILLKLIKDKIDKKQEYQHQIPLQKVGEHFTINVHINNEPITLLLDTGATLTMINEKKLSSTLTLRNENIVLNTAGGQINAQLQEADTFSVGKLELEKFQIITSHFEQKDAEGLLGMNFFKKFKFKVDQEKAILYLSEKY